MTLAVREKQFTGKRMLAYLVAFFGVIIAVNVTMAYLASSTWSGLIVKNGYVASQSFDKDLARAQAQDAMGWKVGLSNTTDRIRFTFADAAGAKLDGLAITGQLERPTTAKDDQTLTFAGTGSGVYSAPAKLTPGVWELEIEAKQGADLRYRKIFRFMVQG